MLTVTPAEPRHILAIADLMEELDRFYGGTETAPLEQRTAQLRALLFDDVPAAYVLLAHEGDRVVGMAAYSFLWPAVGFTRSLFLKELYVRQDKKRQGIGRALMRRVCDVAAAYECSRVEWMTEQGNTDAQRFYAALGAEVNADKVVYRLEEKSIELFGSR
jgi:GNAT superfamily N-acetyltransferase